MIENVFVNGTLKVNHGFGIISHFLKKSLLLPRASNCCWRNRKAGSQGFALDQPSQCGELYVVKIPLFPTKCFILRPVRSVERKYTLRIGSSPLAGPTRPICEGCAAWTSSYSIVLTVVQQVLYLECYCAGFHLVSSPRQAVSLHNCIKTADENSDALHVASPMFSSILKRCILTCP